MVGSVWSQHLFMIALTRNFEVTLTNIFFRFPSIWLRFNCHCLECKQDQTRAKLINPATIDLETTIKATEITDNGINQTLSVIIALNLFIFTARGIEMQQRFSSSNRQ